MPWIIGVAFAVWLLVLLGLTLFLVFMEENSAKENHVHRLPTEPTDRSDLETTGPIGKITGAPLYDWREWMERRFPPTTKHYI